MNEIPTWLTSEELAVYRSMLPKIRQVTPARLRMLAAYANAVINLRRVQQDPGKARVWRGAMLYARNGLGLGDPVFIDLMELICDSGMFDEPAVVSYLEPEWQIERPVGYDYSHPNY